MSGTSGSEKRQRHRDVRIRLRDEDELKQFDQIVRNTGFHGPHARGDWLRSHLPGVVIRPAPPPPSLTIHPWVDAIAAIDGLATEIADLHKLLTRMETGQIRFGDADRLRTTFPAIIARLLVRADTIIGEMHGRIEPR
ncbi:hypothetical protein ACVOMT_15860 [Sphingomonas panni]